MSQFLTLGVNGKTLKFSFIIRMYYEQLGPMLKPFVLKFRPDLSAPSKEIAEKQVPAKLKPIVGGIAVYRVVRGGKGVATKFERGCQRREKRHMRGRAGSGRADNIALMLKSYKTCGTEKGIRRAWGFLSTLWHPRWRRPCSLIHNTEQYGSSQVCRDQEN